MIKNREGEIEGWKKSNVEAQLSKNFTKGETEKKYFFLKNQQKKPKLNQVNPPPRHHEYKIEITNRKESGKKRAWRSILNQSSNVKGWN
jgi:hypothetical protein